MACGTDGNELAPSEIEMLRTVMKEAKVPSRIADETQLPIFKVRSGMRSLVERQFVVERDGAYEATEKTIARLSS